MNNALTTPEPVTPIDEMAVQRALAIMSELVQVLEAEPEHLSLQDPAPYQALVLKKQRLLLDYTAILEHWRAAGAMLAELPTQLRADLRAMQAKLKEATLTNERLLKAAYDGTKRLVQSIIFEVRRESEQLQSYNNREAQLAGQSYQKIAKPVAVDTKI